MDKILDYKSIRVISNQLGEITDTYTYEYGIPKGKNTLLFANEKERKKSILPNEGNLLKDILIDRIKKYIKNKYMLSEFIFVINEEYRKEKFIDEFKNEYTQDYTHISLTYKINLFNKSKSYSIERVFQVCKDVNWRNFLKEFSRDFKEFLTYNCMDHLSVLNYNSTEIGDLIMIHGAGGVFVHEIFGHSLEYDNVINNKSIFTDKMKSKIGISELNIVDEPLPHQKYSNEGSISKKVVLVKNGFLENYLTSEFYSNEYKFEDTGNGRNDSFQNFEFPRMRRTYIDKGNYKFEDIVKETKQGLLAIDFGGASVDTKTGNFSINIKKGLLIKNGKYIGYLENILYQSDIISTLNKIDRIGNDLSICGAACIKNNQRVYVEYGQPTIRIRKGI